MSIFYLSIAFILLLDMFFVIYVFFQFILFRLDEILFSRWYVTMLGILNIFILMYAILFFPRLARAEPLCMKLNNPMCIVAMPKDNPWQGQIGKTKEGLAKFDDMTNGLRAGFITLSAYHFKHKINTVEGVIKRYATGGRTNYVSFVSKRLGVTGKDKINILHNMSELMAAIITFENGYCPFSIEFLKENYNVSAGKK